MSKLFETTVWRDLTLRNRLMVSPMCQYSAEQGRATDYHLIHLGRFALGGFGLVMVEATAVLPEGRITHGDLGLWADDQIAPLRRIATVLKANGAAAGIQLAHAGPKASSQRPWQGNGPLAETDFARGEMNWDVVAASENAYAPGWLTPRELNEADMARIREAFVAATRRAAEAGFDVVEVHCAHGYLLNSFLSPVTNTRADRYGGDLDGRMRFPLEVVDAVRQALPQDKPLFVRISAVDGIREGASLEQSIVFARRLKALGVDLVDCSSGGIAPRYDFSSSYGYQVPYADAVRHDANMPTAAVGLIVDPAHAETIVAEGHADIVAVGREALFDPNWALHAKDALAPSETEPFAAWPPQTGWWLKGRVAQIRSFAPAAASGPLIAA